MGVKLPAFLIHALTKLRAEHEVRVTIAIDLAAARSPVSHQQGHSLAIFRRDCLVDTGQIPAVSFSPRNANYDPKWS
jgi:hypothetical protein